MAKDGDEETRAEQLQFWFESMARESDRGIVLICGELIDHHLMEAIKTLFRKLASSNDQERFKAFTTGFGPLASGRAKEEFAYFTKIVGPETYSDLQAIRGIRNWFAHNVSKRTHGPGTAQELSFMHPKVANKIRTLKTQPTKAMNPMLNPISEGAHRSVFSWLYAKDEMAQRFVLSALSIADMLGHVAFTFGMTNPVHHDLQDGSKVIVQVPYRGMRVMEFKETEDNVPIRKVIMYAQDHDSTALP